MNWHKLNKVIRYVTSTKQDFYHALSDPNDLTVHGAYADYLDEKEHPEPELAARIRHEVNLTRSGAPIRPARLGDAYSDHDFVLHAVRTGHQNPTVRALAQQTKEGMPPSKDLLDLLFHSDPVTRPTDHDVAVFLSPEDPVNSHSAHATVRKLNSNANRDAGLEAKVVRGRVYLLDNEHPDHAAYGAPAVVFESPVNDRDELQALEHHANQLRAERAGMGPAQMGPVEFDH